jgi:hypothetical protein
VVSPFGINYKDKLDLVITFHFRCVPTDGRNEPLELARGAQPATRAFSIFRCGMLEQPGFTAAVLCILLAVAVLARPATAASLRYQHDLSNHHRSSSRGQLSSTADDDGQLRNVRVCQVHSTTTTTTANSRRHCDYVSTGAALAAARDHSVVDVEAGRYFESTVRVRANNVTLRYAQPPVLLALRSPPSDPTTTAKSKTWS